MFARTAPICIAIGLLCFAGTPVLGQVPFNFSAPTEAISVTNARGAYLVKLDVVGSPTVRCWKDGGLMEKACAALTGLHTAGYSGYNFDLSSPATYDVRSLQITASDESWEAEPEWSVQNGCVDNVLVVNDDVRQVHIAADPTPMQVTCDASVGGLLGAICEGIEVGDCGTFEGHITGTLIMLDQILARRGFFGY
jgi:hypothetical protein